MKRLSWKHFIGVACITPLLVACGNGGTASGPTTAPVTTDPTSATGDSTGAPSTELQPGMIEVEPGATLRFAAAGNPTEQQLYIEGAARFEALYGVPLTFEPVSDYQTQIKAQFTAGTAPDVFLLDGELMGAFAPNGLLLPLDEYMAEAGVTADAYFEPTIELYQMDGNTYGLPKDFNPLVVFVNNQIAEEAGVDPASIQTWDDLSQAAEAMSSGSGPGRTYGMCLNADILRSGAFIFQTGNPFIDGTDATFNEPEAVEAIEFWRSFLDNDSGELFGNLGRGWCGEAFAASNTAMAIEGGWMIPFLNDPSNGAQDLEYTAIPLPIPEGGQQATWLFTNGFAVNANTQYPRAAAAAVLYLAGLENQQELISSGLAQPTLRELQNDPYYTDNPVARVLVEQGQNGFLADTVLGGPVLKGDVLNVLNSAQERIFLGTQSVQEALDQAAQEVEAILNR